MLSSNTQQSVYSQQLSLERCFSPQNIDVYNASTFNVERSIPVSDTLQYSRNLSHYKTWNEFDTDTDLLPHSGHRKKMNTPFHTDLPLHGFTACSHHKCLYISGLENYVIYRISVRSNRKMAHWSVDCMPSSLSTTSDHNVLVASCGKRTIMEYTTHGDKIRQINLWAAIESPAGVVQLSNGRYGVIHHGRTPGYSVVDANGRLIKRYGSESGVGNANFGQSGLFGKPVQSTARRRKSSIHPRKPQTDDQRRNKPVVLNAPCALAVIRPDKVLIADQSNNRLLALTENETSFTAKWLSASLFGGLNYPRCMHFDAARKRLYVSDSNGDRVHCCGM